MKRAALLVLVLAAALVVVPGTAAFACSCAAPPVADQVTRADLVVRGTVGEPAGDGTVVTYPVEVTVAFKGTPPRTVEVRSPRDGASCGLEVVPGREYLLFATDRGGALEAGLCGGTAPASAELQAGVVAVTGAGHPPVRTPGPPASGTAPSARSSGRSVGAARAPGPLRQRLGAGVLSLAGIGTLAAAAAAVLLVRRRRL
ncbi:hypothetical protein [Phycicoccus sp. Root101]|uniref:hypothetical protein n=1 Tax=Phycicoccus sp. Root101 TaxID=1736421 RepID=UPI000702DAD6|nr:hypothetical protein [Phycicoccus sp. Root101]KQU66478.1 hypothetical protein ASC58_15725 [Phycicoccus sp. Root101]